MKVEGEMNQGVWATCDLMSKCSIEEFFWNLASKCLLEEYSKEKKSRTRSIFEWTFDEKKRSKGKTGLV